MTENAFEAIMPVAEENVDLAIWLRDLARFCCAIDDENCEEFH